MSVTFTKLFSSITESTVWCEPHATRITWIAMLAMADRKGRIWASIPGLANRSRVTIEEARAAISTFLGPDPDSRTPDNDGRRIEPIDGGWRLLNYDKYRTLQNEENVLESKRRYIRARRERERLEKETEGKDVEESRNCRGREIQAEAEAEAEESKPTIDTLEIVKPLSGKPDDAQKKSGGNPERKKLSEACAEVLNFLNEKTGRRYRPVKANITLIAARLKEGATVTECRQVIAKKCREWRDDPNREIYLRPKTLFSATNFAQYVGELGVAA